MNCLPICIIVNNAGGMRNSVSEFTIYYNYFINTSNILKCYRNILQG